MTRSRHNAARIRRADSPLTALTDQELLDQLDQLVGAAATGDRAAVGAIFIGFGPMLVREARVALGPALDQDAGDVLQDFSVRLLEGALRYPRIRGGALPWMRRMVRLIAEAHARERGWGGDLAG